MVEKNGNETHITKPTGSDVDASRCRRGCFGEGTKALAADAVDGIGVGAGAGRCDTLRASGLDEKRACHTPRLSLAREDGDNNVNVLQSHLPKCIVTTTNALIGKSPTAPDWSH